MRTFSCFITDDRYSVPTLSFVIAEDERRAEELVRRNIMISPHHIEVEVLDGERSVCAWRRDQGQPGRSILARRRGDHALSKVAR